MNRAPSIPTVPASKSFLFIQLTRIGDLIQTLQAVSPLKEHFPDVKLKLVARKKFARPLLKRLEEVFDEIHLLGPINEQGNNLFEIRNSIREFAAEINRTPTNVSLNLSFSKSSSYLHSLVKSDHKIGPYYNLANDLCVNDTWSKYLYSTVLTGPYNPFSLVDLYSFIIGLPRSQASSGEERAKQKKRIIMHPFASQERKVWKITKWVDLIYRILNSNSDIVINICGDQTDRPHAEGLVNNPLLKKFRGRLNNWAGKYSVEDLYHNMNSDDLFVGHDSMVGHLCSLKGLQTLTITLGNARYKESTPFGANNFVLAPRSQCYPCVVTEKCHLYQCHADISFELAAKVTLMLVQKGEVLESEFAQQASIFHTSGADLYQSVINANGTLSFRSLFSNTPRQLEIFQSFYQYAWKFLFEESEEPLSIPTLTDKSYELLLTSLQGVQHLYELFEFGKKYSRFILEEISTETPDISKIKKFGEKIDEIDRLIDIVSNQHPYLGPITNFSTISKANLAGGNLVELTESSFYVFCDSSNLCQIFYELINKTVGEYRKKSPQPNKRP